MIDLISLVSYLAFAAIVLVSLVLPYAVALADARLNASPLYQERMEAEND